MAGRAEPILLTALACRLQASSRGGIWYHYAVAAARRGCMALTKAPTRGHIHLSVGQGVVQVAFAFIQRE